MIRQATSNDLDMLYDLCSANIKEKQVEEQSGGLIDPDSVRAVIRYHIIHNDGFAYVSESDGAIDGVFLGCVMPWIFDLNYKAAHEKMCFGKNLDELWKNFLEWAVEKNAITCVRSCIEVMDGTRFRRLR